MPFWQSIADIRNPMLSIHLLHLSPISPISTAILAVKTLFSVKASGVSCWQFVGSVWGVEVCVCGSQRRIRVGPANSVKPVGAIA